ncbi:MAG: dihydroorotate dehydrogenase [Thermoplasmata archaeon]|nr:dihydroorotate dehydrogenase [Thermoplasmata archaeon]
MADLRTAVGSVRLRNPFLLASGIWGESGASLSGAVRAGAAAAVTKSIGELPRPGYPNPTVESFDRWGFLNAMGLPNPGIDEYPQEVEAAVHDGATLIGSVFGGDAPAYARVALRMAATGVVALELNLSCPHAKGLGSEIGQDPDQVVEVTRAVVREVKIPVWVKITPNTSDPAGLAAAAEAGGASAITAINTVRGLAIEPMLRRPVLSNGLGGLSGPAIRPIGVACVWQIFQKVRIPIVGVGGIAHGRDALEYLLAGARAVQVGTQVGWDGIGVFGRLNRELDEALTGSGFRSVEEAVGAAHPARAAGTV